MPSKKRKRRARKPLPWLLILWAICAVNIALGCFFSPITKARTVRVKGELKQDQARLQGIINRAAGIPAMQVQKEDLLSRVLLNPRIRSASYTQNLFGRGLLSMTLKPLAAVVSGSPKVALAEDGSFVPINTPMPELPEIVLPAGASQPSPALAALWESGRMAQFCVKLKREFPVTAWKAAVNDQGVISLRKSEQDLVILGSSEKLSDKLKKLKEILTDDPDILDQYQVILTAPDSPMKKPLGSR